jgi:hypothetical protein
MGSSQSIERRLTPRQTQLDVKGLLQKTIGEVWETDSKLFEGEYAKALLMRRESKPVMYSRILETVIGIHVQTTVNEVVAADGSVDLEAYLTDSDSVITSESQSMMRNGRRQKKFENHTVAEKKTKPTGIIDDKHGISRAHLLPADEDCYKYWGKVVQLLCGIPGIEDDSVYKKITEYVRDLKVNLLVLDGQHDEYFDTLQNGFLIPIPLLSQDDIGRWKTKQAYDVLILCDSADTYQRLEKDTQHPHVKWATEDDLKLAEQVLGTNIKILADSLCEHWEEFHNKQGSAATSTKHAELGQLRGELQAQGCHVSVPKLSTNSSKRRKMHLNPWNPLDKRLRLIKVDYSMVYKGPMAAYIPDPWLVALKGAINWSAWCHEHNLKLLPACGNADDASSFSGYSGATEALAGNTGLQNLLFQQRTAAHNLDIEGRDVNVVSDDERSESSMVSSMGGSVGEDASLRHLIYPLPR